MSRNLAWTSELGEASVNQRQDLTNAIQALRQRARQAGNLSTTTQETVSTKGQTIIIQPAATDVVYLPQPDPWLLYGASMAVFPGWYPYPGLSWTALESLLGLTFELLVGRAVMTREECQTSRAQLHDDIENQRLVRLSSYCGSSHRGVHDIRLRR
jgi:Protein of unknown function (DUF3300)